jgi:hypothetical protein
MNLNFDLPKVKDSIKFISQRKIREGVYDITASLSKAMDRDDAASLFRETVTGKASMVAGSYRIVDQQNNVIRFAARTTRKLKNYSDCASMTSVGNSEFTDVAGSIWAVVEEDGARYLVCNEQDDLDDILATHASRMGVTASYMANPVKAAKGDFASVISDTGALAYGFIGSTAEGKPTFINMDSQTVSMLDTATVIEALEPDVKCDLAALSSADYNKVFAYLMKVYPQLIPEYRNLVGA